MAKKREQELAQNLYVFQGKTAKEISELVNVSEPTISKWVNELGWKAEKAARNANPAKQLENIKQIIFNLSEDRIGLENKLKNAEAGNDREQCDELRKHIAQIDDAASKWNKTLVTIDKENKISLSEYLACMRMLFEALMQYDPKLFMATTDFQRHHLNDVSLKFK